MKKRNEDVRQTAAPAEKPKRFKLPFSAYLSYLLVACLLLTGVTFSGYVSTVSGGDGASVAKFEITAEMSKDGMSIDLIQPITAALAPGETDESHQVVVENKSDVTVAYTVTTGRDEGVHPLPELEAKLTYMSGEAIWDDTNKYYTLAPGKQAEFKMALHWPAEENDLAYMGQVDQMWVQLTAMQVD